MTRSRRPAVLNETERLTIEPRVETVVDTAEVQAHTSPVPTGRDLESAPIRAHRVAVLEGGVMCWRLGRDSRRFFLKGVRAVQVHWHAKALQLPVARNFDFCPMSNLV